MTTLWKISVSALFIFNAIKCEEKNETKCIESEFGTDGICVPLNDCPYALSVLEDGIKLENCEANNGSLLVCCPKEEESSNTSELPMESIIFGGTKVANREYRHMAVLGYGPEDDIKWLCGGSLITDKLVLTAAHCIHPQIGDVKWVRLGDLDLDDTLDIAEPQNFHVKEVFVHPDYKYPSHYHDIALILLNQTATLTDFVHPACLHENRTDLPSDLVITGWGKVDFLGVPSSYLLEANVHLLEHKKCAEKYTNISKRKLAMGIVEEFQLCAGHPEGKDTCPGDSGGPLQFEYGTEANKCYYVVGVTSFGKACGVENSAGVYTRVSHYVPWIKDIIENLEKVYFP